MPRKLRTPKQRYDAKAELEAWSMSFECGTDFFGETGFPLPHRVQPPEDQPAAERAFRVAAHAAWLRVGSLFLQKRDADKSIAPCRGRWSNSGRHAGKDASRERPPAPNHARGRRGVQGGRLHPPASCARADALAVSPLPVEVKASASIRVRAPHTCTTRHGWSRRKSFSVSSRRRPSSKPDVASCLLPAAHASGGKVQIQSRPCLCVFDP